jgi:hypothetical protein
MKIFKINEQIQIECEWKRTRVAFKHTARLRFNDRVVDETKICYLNRTWESYEFESVLRKLIQNTKALSKDQKEKTLAFIENYQEENVFKGLLMATKIGDILCNTKEEKNNFKKRMMIARLGETVSFPEDWDKLPEDEKERRLNGGLDALA